MKITYIHQYFNTPGMSGGTRSFEMARRLVSMGHEVNMITSWRDPHPGSDWFVSIESGISVHWLPVSYSNMLSYEKRIFSFFKFAIFSALKAAEFPADVIFATSTPLTVALPGIFASRLKNVPMVFEVRDLWPELPIAMGALRNPCLRRLACWLEKFAYRSSNEIISLSPGMTSGIIKTGYPPDHVTEIPNGSDLELFSSSRELRRATRLKYKINPDQILVVYTGTFGRINGVSYLAHLANALALDPRFCFMAVGGGYEYGAVQKLAIDYGILNKNFRMLGNMPKSDIPAILSAADVATSLFVPLKAMEANSANKFFDGLAAGCCMAINYGGWQSSLLEERGAGLRLDLNVSVAARQLAALADNPEMLLRAKGSARMIAEDLFSRDRLASDFCNVLERAVLNRYPAG